MLCKRWTWQALPKVVENEDLYFRLGLDILRPCGHGPKQFPEGGQEGSAGLFEILSIGLADSLLEEQVEQSQFIFTESLFCCSSLLCVQAVCQLA